MAAGDGQGGLVVQQERLEVRVGVVLAGLVMAVIRLRRSELFQPSADVVDEAALRCRSRRWRR